MRKVHDARLAYRGEFDAESICRCRVFREDGKPPVVLLSEVPDNPGTTLMHGQDSLVLRLWKKLRQPEEFVLLFDDGDSVDEVVFTTGGQGTGFLRPGRALCETDSRSWSWDFGTVPAEVAEAVGMVPKESSE